MKLRDALAAGMRRLAAAGVEDAARDARRLMAHVAGVGADRVTLHLADELTGAQVSAWDAAMNARVARQPVAQIVGERLFWGRAFRVTRDTLDPRPETEVLVAAALERDFARVLDLGTGTGCILLSLLGDRAGATGLGTDLSEAALDVARGNAGALGLGDRAAFRDPTGSAGIEGRFDLIVSNPPYIAADEMAGLAPDVRDWEPHLALTPGGDGLAAYRAIAAGSGVHLAPGGAILLEIGPTQANAVAELLGRAGFRDIEVLRDMDGRDRVVRAAGPMISGKSGQNPAAT